MRKKEKETRSNKKEWENRQNDVVGVWEGVRENHVESIFPLPLSSMWMNNATLSSVQIIDE